MPSIRDEITRTFARIGKWLPEQPTTDLPTLHIRSQVEQYRVLRKLGSGGMGYVYLALDTKLGRHVALKALSPQFTAEPVYVSRFKQEALAASALNHPNILTIYDFIETEGAQVIVSEFVDGTTLRAVMERKVLDVNQSLDIACQVASALMAAHAAGVVHRDLKPTNIMVRPDGYVKVIDFGLAKLAERSGLINSPDRSLTRPGTVVGTVRYMSPEQARGEKVDHRGDLWSLGVVLYEMVSGHPPFEGSTDNHLIVAILDMPPRAVPAERSLPPGLEEVLRRALAKDRKQRYQTASEFMFAIQSVQRAGGSIQTVHIPRPDRVAGRRWAYSAVLALVLAAFFLWWGPFGGSSRVQGSDWFEVGQTERLTYDGDVRRATLSPDGKWLAYTTGSSGSELLHLKNILSGDERTLPAIRDVYAGLTFSPDCSTLFFVLRDVRQELGTLYSVPVREFARVPDAIVLRDVDGPIAFSPEGDTFAFLRRKELDSGDMASILTAPVNDVRQVRSIVSLHGGQVYSRLSWSSSGIAVVVLPSSVGHPSQPSVYVYDRNGKLQSRGTSPQLRMLGSPAFLSGGSILLTALTQGSFQARLEQLSLRNGQWHTVTSDLAGFDDVSVSSDGASIEAVRSLTRSSVWVVGAHGGSAVRVTPDTEYYPSLAWMSDGRLIVPSARTGNLNLMMISGSALQPLIAPRPAFESDPATVAQHEDVVFSSNAAHGGDEFNIWRVVPGHGEPQLITSGGNADFSPQITPDGKWVVYTSSISGAQTLWKVPITGGRPESLSSYRAKRPFISPDGREVACEVRERDGDWKVAILALSDGKIVREMPSLPIGGLVRWSPDGTALDYIEHADTGWVIRRQSLAGGKPVELVRSPEQQIVYFAWSLNGDRLAYILKRGETDAVLLHRAARH